MILNSNITLENMTVISLLIVNSRPYFPRRWLREKVIRRKYHFNRSSATSLLVFCGKYVCVNQSIDQSKCWCQADTERCQADTETDRLTVHKVAKYVENRWKSKYTSTRRCGKLRPPVTPLVCYTRRLIIHQFTNSTIIPHAHGWVIAI